MDATNFIFWFPFYQLMSFRAWTDIKTDRHVKNVFILFSPHFHLFPSTLLQLSFHCYLPLPASFTLSLSCKLFTTQLSFSLHSTIHFFWGLSVIFLKVLYLPFLITLNSPFLVVLQFYLVIYSFGFL